MARCRSQRVAFKRQVAQEYLSGETLHGLAKRHDISRNLVRIWVQKSEVGALDEDAAAADTIQVYEARIAALERLVGRQALELEVFKRGVAQRTAAEKRAYVRDRRPRHISIAKGCRLTGRAHSTFYDAPARTVDDTALVEATATICDGGSRTGAARVWW